MPSHPLLVAALAGGLSVSGLILALRWRRFEQFLRSEEARVAQIAGQSPAPSERAAELAELMAALPAPVRRFFERSLGEEYAQFRMWVARGSGGLRFDGGDGWKDLASTTHGAVGAPALCYTGSLSLGLGGLLWCRGREALLDGRGAMAWRLWGALTLACHEGGRLDQSALLRWLAEAVCYPPALLPSAHLRWLPSESDPEHSAEAVVTCRGSTARATLTFDGEGRFVELLSGDYWRVMPDGGMARTQWRARGSRHRRFGLGGGGAAAGVEIPTYLEAAWLEPDGSEYTHIRFNVTELRGV